MCQTLLSVLIFAVAVCASNAASSSDISSITLEYTACFGTCPMYTVTIFRDGRVVYEGKGFVKARGVRRKSIPVIKFIHLTEKLSEIGFFQLRNAYRSNITDLPRIFIAVTRGSETKSVEDYYGANRFP